MNTNCVVCFDTRNTAHNNKPQMLTLDNFNQFAELLCAAAETAHFQCNDGIPCLGQFQQHLKLLLRLGVAVLKLIHNLISARCLQFLYLPIDVLLTLVCGATRISVTHRVYLLL